MSQPLASNPRPVSDGFELRGTPRVGADYEVELQVGDLPAPLVARTRDVGVTGACVATASPFAIKSLHRVVLHLPAGRLSPGEGRLSLEAEGRWQRETRTDAAVLTGISFIEPPAKAIDVLWDVVLDAGKELARFLYSHTDLNGMGVEEALGLAQISRYRDVPAGQTLYRQDTARPGEDSIFLVMQGAVLLQVRVRDARETLFARVGPGQIFGGMPLIAEAPHAESAVAESAARLLEIDRDAWNYLRTAKPWLAHRMAASLDRVVARRLRDVLVRVRDAL